MMKINFKSLSTYIIINKNGNSKLSLYSPLTRWPFAVTGVNIGFLKVEPAELISSALWYRQANMRSTGRMALMSSGLRGQYWWAGAKSLGCSEEGWREEKQRQGESDNGLLKKKRERARVERCQRLKQQTNKPCVLFSVLSVLVVIHVNVFPTLEMEI